GQSLARGGDAAPILEAAADLARRKKERRRGKPSLKLSFPMTRLNLRELPDIVPIAAEAGADGVVFRNLDYLPGERWNILRAFHHESPTPAFQETVGEILKAGEKAKIYVEVAPLKAEEIPVCEADPPNRIFFSADGSVAPCPYLCLPKKGNIPRIYQNRGAQDPRVTFGNVNDEDYADIWAKTEYVDFRTIFAERKAAAREHAARMLDPASQAGSTPAAGSHEAPPLPEVCRTCYKAYGI
ncbi:MAG TPA: SPASM domain-containing protein, partial [Thermodesulfobacteriota bacterium]|nr:SPASM domain-containing protein [Thermodesulfobacteriota bacterium]